MRYFLTCLVLFILIGVTVLSEEAQTVQQQADLSYQEGMTALEEADYLFASDAFETAVSLDKDIFFLLSGNGIFERLLQSKDPEIAVHVAALCQEIIKDKEKRDVFTYYYLGWAQFVQGELSKALDNLKKAKTIMDRDGLVDQNILNLLSEVETRQEKS